RGDEAHRRPPLADRRRREAPFAVAPVEEQGPRRVRREEVGMTVVVPVASADHVRHGAPTWADTDLRAEAPATVARVEPHRAHVVDGQDVGVPVAVDISGRDDGRHRTPARAYGHTRSEPT